MGRKRVPVVCEPFELDEAQELALTDAVADVIAARLIRERDAAELPRPRGSGPKEK